MNEIVPQNDTPLTQFTAAMIATKIIAAHIATGVKLMTQGSHIMLDCTGAVGIDGDWMLSLMEKAVDASGARRVHSHNERI